MVNFRQFPLLHWSGCGDKSSAAVKLHKTAEPNAHKNTEDDGGKELNENDGKGEQHKKKQWPTKKAKTRHRLETWNIRHESVCNNNGLDDHLSVTHN